MAHIIAAIVIVGGFIALGVMHWFTARDLIKMHDEFTKK